MKVMAGDNYNTRVASDYGTFSVASNNPNNVITDLFNALVAGIPIVSGGKETTAQLTVPDAGLSGSITRFVNTQTTSGFKPKAYINWIVFVGKSSRQACHPSYSKLEAS